MRLFKQVVVVRGDLEMSPGKLAAQVAHASLEAFLEAQRLKPEWAKSWLLEGQKKVVLVAKDKEALLQIKDQVGHLPNALVIDAGRTELEPGTVTCLGIGPAPELELDRFTGRLPLLR